MGCQIFVWTLCWVYLVRLPIWVGLIQSTEGLVRIKRQNKEKLPSLLISGWGISLLLLISDWNLYYWLSWLLGLQSWASIIALALLGLQLANGRSWDFLAYIITWVNSLYNRLSSIMIWFFFFYFTMCKSDMHLLKKKFLILTFSQASDMILYFLKVLDNDSEVAATSQPCNHEGKQYILYSVQCTMLLSSDIP